MFDVNKIEVGDRVKFKYEACKKRKYLRYNRELGVPACLVGLKVDGKEVDKNTDFLVLDIKHGEWGVEEGVYLQTDFGELYFDFCLVEFSSM